MRNSCEIQIISLRILLDEIAVDDLGGQEPFDQNLTDWFGVSDERGIYAYFGTEKDALRFRLAEINRRLNG